MDILLIDAVNVFGNGYMLPRGTLREPISHIDRADVCLLTKVDQATDASRSYIKKIVRETNDRALLVESIHQPRCFVEISDWSDHIASEGIDTSQMKGKRVMAVSAIGNPASFEQTLSGLGTVVIESLRFPDHHDYTVGEMLDVAGQAAVLGAEAVVITEKDAVKVPPETQEQIGRQLNYHIPIYVLSVEVTFRDGEKPLIDLIAEDLEKKVKKEGVAS